MKQNEHKFVMVSGNDVHVYTVVYLGRRPGALYSDLGPGLGLSLGDKVYELGQAPVVTYDTLQGATLGWIIYSNSNQHKCCPDDPAGSCAGGSSAERNYCQARGRSASERKVRVVCCC